ncbi:hypothetical protein A9996_15985 [Gelidibacter algens]|nr:hypothetical protein A9996_15985 [Gelidibacter algens]
MSVGKRQLLIILVRWLFAVGKNDSAVLAVAFFIRIFDVVWVFCQSRTRTIKSTKLCWKIPKPRGFGVQIVTDPAMVYTRLVKRTFIILQLKY